MHYFTDSFVEPEKAIALLNGDIIIVGNKETGYGPVAWICKVNANGIESWSRAFLNSDSDIVGVCADEVDHLRPRQIDH